MTKTEDAELELATMDCLRGAGDLKDRLVLELSTGTPSISDLAYAVKIRVKADYSIIDKVKKKRESNSEYGVTSLRDVIGVRIVTLYRLDALTIIPMVLDMIERSGDNGPFESDSLEEIRIYSTNPSGDAQALSEKLMRVFIAAGYEGMPQVVENPNNYTSIHMVMWGRGKYQDGYRRVPIEIQVRTAFEDTWGEIEHKLK